MIRSKYITEILNLLLELDCDGRSLKPQLKFLSDDKYEYTGSGLIVRFTYDNEGKTHRIESENLVLDGVAIRSTELEDGAAAMLFISDGQIEYLEIHSRNGKYPNIELTNYALEINMFKH